MEKVHFTFKFKRIEPQNLNEFKELAGTMLEVARGESGLLLYNYYFNPDQTVCVVQELYENSDAVLVHMSAMSGLLPRAIELGGGFEAECYGDITSKLVDALAGLPTYSFFQGK